MTRRLESALLVLAIAAVALFALHPITSPDVWWQLAAGERILADGPPTTDPFSYAYPGRAWIEPRWLYCALAALIAKLTGLNGLILAKVAVLLVTFGVLAAIAPRRARWVLPLGLAAALALMFDRFGVRPELVSFLALALTLRLLEGWRRGEAPRRLALLPLLQLVWNNAHTLWVLGPAVQWLWLAGESAARFARRRRSTVSDPRPGPSLRAPWLAAIASTLVAPLNPWGLDGALMPLRLLSQLRGGHELEALIGEFRGPLSSTFLAADHRTLALLVVAALSAAGFAVCRRSVSWGRFAVWLAFAGLALDAVRNVALFGLVAGVTLITNLTDRWGERPPAIVRRVALAVPAIWLITMIPLLVTDAFYVHQQRDERFGLGVSDRRFPIRAMTLVRGESLPRPVLHALGDGGYMLYDGGPLSAYVDGRLEVYDGTIVAHAAHMLRTGEGLEREAERFGIETIVVRNRFDERGALATLERSPRWRAVYFDHLHVVYLRATPTTRAAIERLAIDWDDPRPQRIERPARLSPVDPLAGLWPRVTDGFAEERLGSLLLGVGNDTEARRHLERAYELGPRNPRVRLLLGVILRAQGAERRADELLAGVPTALRERPDVRWLEGEVALRAGRPRLALEAFAAARDAAPDEAIYLNRYIVAALAANRSAEAEAGLREWLERRPRDVPGWNELGRLLWRSGRRDEAARCLERSLAIAPDQPSIRALLDGPPPAGSG